jgi:prepilin-type processing-associated H-X9-DG protein
MSMTSTGTSLPVVGMQSITDGTSNTALVSERLLSLYPIGTSTLVYPSGGNSAWRAVFQGPSVAPNSSTVAANTAILFAQGCQSIPSTTPSLSSSVVGVQMMAGGPAAIVVSSYMHWTAPNTAPCANGIDAITVASNPPPFGFGAVGPYGSASANSLHSGGVNVGFADGSVHFIKSTVSLPAWWALGTRNLGEVLSSDQY